MEFEPDPPSALSNAPAMAASSSASAGADVAATKASIEELRDFIPSGKRSAPIVSVLVESAPLFVRVLDAGNGRG
jgi:hypothetical protein